MTDARGLVRSPYERYQARDWAAETEIVGPAETFRCAAFWQVRDGRLHRGVEYWVTVGGDEPPPARAGEV